MMNVTMLGHSGFLVETQGYALVFDYYKGTLPQDAMANASKRVVLASHAHHDHYNPAIFSWEKTWPPIHFVFSHDIPKRPAAVYLSPGETFCQDALTIKAYGSTDQGVSFLVRVGTTSLFHAGDLNLWHWRDESTPEEIHEATQAFRKAMESLIEEETVVDAAFFPVDPRLRTGYDDGARFFLENIPCRAFFPMHYGKRPHRIQGFLRWAAENSFPVRFLQARESDSL